MLFIYESRAWGWYAVHFVVLGFASVVDRLFRTNSTARWRLCVAGIAALAVAFVASAIAGSALRLRWTGGEFALVLDMFMVLRLSLYLWELGAGRFDRPEGLEFLAWCALPFTAIGPFLRLSEFRRQRPWETDPDPLDKAWWVGVAASVGMLTA